MIEVTDEMVRGAHAEFDRTMGRTHDVRLRAVIAAVAPLIEAQARAAEADRNLLWARKYAELADSLVQARAAAIEEAAKALPKVVPLEGDPWDAGWNGALEEAHTAICALASRPVSERGGADTAPAPAISGGEMVNVPRELLGFVQSLACCTCGKPCDANPIDDSCEARRLVDALAAADRSASL